MKRLKHYVNHMSVGQKLIYYSYVIIAPILMIISLSLLYYNFLQEKGERLESNLESIAALSGSVDVLQSDIKDISTYIAVNNEITKLLKAENIEEHNGDALVWRNETPIDMIQDMISIKGHIKTIAIYSENGIRPYLRGMDGSVYLQDMESVHASEIYQKTIASKNGMLWAYVGSGVGSVYESSFSEKVVFCREVYDLSKRTKLCYIVIGVQGAYFEELCSNIIQEDKESVLLIDPNGEVLSRVGEVDPNVEEYLLGEEYLSGKISVGAGHLTVNGYEIVTARTSENGTIACKVLPSYSIHMMAGDSLYTPWLMLVVILIAILPILLIISRMVTKPLGRLSEAIRRFSGGDFTQRVEVQTGDEIGEVAECFNSMVQDIQRLIDENYVITLKEKESELQTLQAQINPHFLYNTLDSLYWQCMGAGQEEIAESILALSDLFRLALNSGRKTVPVSVELNLVSRYLQIQKFRFSKKLDYRIDMAKDTENILLPKLIIQPFVENAVVHGFEDISGACLVTIRTRLIPEDPETDGAGHRGRLHIEVEDNGSGMTREKLAKLWLNEEDPKYRRQRIGRYAIRNIQERLQLKYHDQFRLEIHSMPGEGTTVIMEIPAEVSGESGA